jgi:hypothetical protein
MSKGKGTKPREVAQRFRETFLTDLDGRYPVVRGLKHRHACYTSDLGGTENLSAMEQTLVKRIVHLEHLVEQKESALVSGRAVDINEYLSTVNCLSGLLSKIGLRRRARTVSLKDVLSQQPAPSGALTGREPITRKDIDNGNSSTD